MVSKWVITPVYPIYKLVITHLLIIDPNFLGHPSRTFPLQDDPAGTAFGLLFPGIRQLLVVGTTDRHKNNGKTWLTNQLPLRIQVCPKKGIIPTFLFFSDWIGTLIPIRSGGVWILRVRPLANEHSWKDPPSFYSHFARKKSVLFYCTQKVYRLVSQNTKWAMKKTLVA